LKSIDPTTTEFWKKLQQHFEEIKNTSIKSYFIENDNRKEHFSICLDDLELDYSKNKIDQKIVDLLVDLANEVDLKDGIEKLFTGDKINTTEKRAVLHTALRNTSNEAILVDGEDIMKKVSTSLDKMKTFSEKVISGNHKGYTGKAITDVVNIGIGGSDLGPRMVVDALQFYKNHLNTHFISNIDGDHLAETLKNLNPETTLFIIVSKTFTTQETLTNALSVKDWFLQSANQEDIEHNFVAVSTNKEKVASFGISSDHIFTMWDWVGGRYSLWSAVGLTICIALGFTKFKELLDGAHKVDAHFRNSAFHENIPVVLALISIWYNNFYRSESEAVIPYSQYLSQLVPYLQQLSMESNGKSVGRNKEVLKYQTGNIIWGNTGTNVQHAFMQLIHQGTKLIPVDFIGFSRSLHGNEEHHKKLMANFYAQSEALAIGKTQEEVHLELKLNAGFDEINSLLPYKVFTGNRPSNTLLFDQLTPATLGSLLAIYEHKTFVQGYIWNIFSFDQFGVELGKEMANKRLK
ncbi:MAG: glucose-6-phosphate isomerase, partial [Flavobacteriaceae bacterium]|nr:glucose-6-phosphate isomerase [Flavobacteriaceae bacterium]